MQKGIYKTEESFVHQGSFSVWKGDNVMCSGMSKDEAEQTLQQMIDRQREKITELRLNIHSQEVVSLDEIFPVDKRQEAKSKAIQFKEQLRTALDEIGEL